MTCPACGLKDFVKNGVCEVCHWGDPEDFDRSDTLMLDEDF